MRSFPPIFAALISIGLGVLSQFVLKAGVTRALAAAPSDAGPARLLLGALSQPVALLGLAMYGAAAVVWLYVLARWDVSKAYPLVGLGLALSLLLGAFVFGEKVTLFRSLGVALIVSGVLLVARS